MIIDLDNTFSEYFELDFSKIAKDSKPTHLALIMSP